MDVEKLIALVEPKTQLYEISAKCQTTKIIIDKLWEEVGKEMKYPANDCKAKWVILRNTYARSLRDEKQSILKSESGAKKKKHQWYLRDSMSFLRDYVNHYRTSKSNNLESVNGDNDEQQQQQSSHAEIEYDLDRNIDVKFSTFPEDKVEEEEEEEEEKSLPKVPHPLPCSAPIKNAKNNVLRRSSDKVSSERIKFLKAKSRKPDDHPALIFFKALLPDFLRLSGRRQRSFKETTLSSLHQLIDEQENDIKLECNPYV